MAFVIADRVREFTTTSGTGQVFLGGAAVGFRTFSDGIGNGNSTFYAISVPGGAEWEVGIGTVGVGTLTRDTVLASSNGGAAVNFSAGTKDVFATYAGAGAVMGVGNEIIAPAGARLPVEHGGTGVATVEAEVSRLAGASNASDLLGNMTTADLAESPTNLYYTDARVQAAIPSATTTVAGKVELATSAETQTGTDTTRAVTPAGFTAGLDHSSNAGTTTKFGPLQLATNAETETGTNTAKAVTPAGVTAAIRHSSNAATTTTRGNVELATNAETETGTDTTRAVTPAGFTAGLRHSSNEATTTQRGTTTYATAAQALAGSASNTALTASSLTDAMPAAEYVISDTYGAGVISLTRWQLAGVSYQRGAFSRPTNGILLPTTGLWLVTVMLNTDTAVRRLFADVYPIASTAAGFRTATEMSVMPPTQQTDGGRGAGIFNITSTATNNRTLRVGVFQGNDNGVLIVIKVTITIVRLGPPV